MTRPPSKRSAPSEKQAEAQTLQEAIKGELIDSVQARKAEELSVRIARVIVSEQYSGPLPHPDHFARFELTLPGAADRILCMSDLSLKTRAESERKFVDAEIADRKMGMIFAFASFAALVGCALGALYMGYSTWAASMFLAPALIGGAVAMFIKGREIKS